MGRTVNKVSRSASEAFGHNRESYESLYRGEPAFPGLKLIEEIFLTRAPEVADLRPIVRLTSRLAAPSAAMSRMIGTVVLRYRF